jgi:hypothetical protein
MATTTVQIDIETQVHPTESLEKVQRAIRNIFPDAVFEVLQDGLLRGTSASVDRLKERLAAQAIRDASRKILMRCIRPGHIVFSLSKQAAYAERVNFSEDGPLGDIVVIVRTEQPGLFVDGLTDKKDDGCPPGKGVRGKGGRFTKDDYMGHLED